METNQAEKRKLIEDFKNIYPEFWVGLKQRKASKGYDNFDWEQEPLRSQLKEAGVSEIVQNIRLFHHNYTRSVYFLYGGNIEKTELLLSQLSPDYKVEIYKRPEVTN